MDTVETYAEAMRLTSIGLKQAAKLARQTERAARNEGERELGLAQRVLGHVAYFLSRYQDAVDHYDRAIAHFDAAGVPFEAAVTRSGAILSLIYLAGYDRVTAWSEEAKAVFAPAADRLRLARLQGNLAFAAFRQDRFADAFALYDEVHRELEELGRPVDVANVLWNKSTCLISTGEYARAAAAYREARAFAERHGMPLHVAGVDYNVAYLHYLCGDYAEAMRFYDVARRTGQPYRRALCDLDEAEMYLEINLHREARELARRAMGQFRRLKMPVRTGQGDGVSRHSRRATGRREGGPARHRQRPPDVPARA